MAEFIGRELVSVGVDEPITFENKTDTVFNVSCGIVFRKSGLYRVSIVGRHMSVAVEPEQRIGRWIDDEFGSKCSCCGIHTHLDKFDRPMKFKYCSMCGAKMVELSDVNVYNAELMLDKLLEQAVNDSYVRKPLSWALYQTWKWADANETPREVEND